MKRGHVGPSQPMLTLSSSDLPNHHHKRKGVDQTHVIIGGKGALQGKEQVCGKTYLWNQSGEREE